MKRSSVFSVVLVSVTLSVQADLTRLASARVKSMNELGAAASAISIMAEQPMMGMMAMGALQQGAMQTFGTVDPLKPMAAVLYTKAPLPNFGEMIGSEEMDDFMGAGTNLAYVVLVPISQTAADYLKSRGATNEVGGVFKTDAEMYIVCKDGYAVCSNDPEAAKLAAGEIAKTLAPNLNNMVFEMTVGKILLEKYGEITKKGMEMSQDIAGAPAQTNALEVAVKQYQKASMESMIGMMTQMDEATLGLNYDITAGLSFDMAFRFVKGSELEGVVKNSTPVKEAMYAAVPADSDFFMLVGKTSDSSYDSTKSLKLISDTLVKEIKDAEVRTKAESMIAGCLWMMDNVGETIGFLDRDKEGKMVFVSKAKANDNAKYWATGKSMNADGLAILNKYFPDQKAVAYDQKTGVSSIDFAEGIKMLVAKFGDGEAEDAEEIEVGLKAIDAVVGRKIESVTKMDGDYLSSICKPVGSVYAGPAKSDSAAVLARVKALMPKESKANPSQVMSLSLGSLLKHYGSGIAKAIGEDGAEMAAVFEGQPEAPVGGITAVVWSEGVTLREAVNFSAAECKWFMSFMKACSSMEGDEDVMEGEDETEAEVGDFEIMDDGTDAEAGEEKKDEKPAAEAVEE